MHQNGPLAYRCSKSSITNCSFAIIIGPLYMPHVAVDGVAFCIWSACKLLICPVVLTSLWLSLSLPQHRQLSVPVGLLFVCPVMCWSIQLLCFCADVSISQCPLFWSTTGREYVGYSENSWGCTLCYTMLSSLKIENTLQHNLEYNWIQFWLGLG